jgi:solute:Na+ symporter, SSS family
MGALFARRMKTAGDMFAAGGQSPWWVSGLSAFMTMFSAGTFVVWGGIAFRYGFVAVAISTCYGIAALLAGWTVAGVWRRMGVSSAAEFIQLRFGRSLVQFYTWLQGSIGIFGMGGTIYALAVIVTALIPLPEGHLLANPQTGNLSVTYLSILLVLLVTLVTLIGGLWAVLMTDVLQFIILTVSVVIVVPLCFAEVGGIGAFIEKAPEGFFSPVAADFTYWFLVGWVVVHFFRIGGDWSFVQRFTCVPTPKDARKAAYLFGVMYLVSPLFWMLPPMLYRTVDPSANYEQAYILACKMVLPAGMMGLMVAAMCSASASMVTTVLNVFAGAFTTEVYQRYINPNAPPKRVVRVGRIITFVLGGVILAGALLIPRLGSYTGYVLSVTAIITGPFALPTMWALFSRKIGIRTAWLVSLGGFFAGLFVKFGFNAGGWFGGILWLEPVSRLVQVNVRVTDLVVGSVVPLVLRIVAELTIKRHNPGWERVQAHRRAHAAAAPAVVSTLPAIICGWAMAALAALVATLAALDAEDRLVLGIFAAILALIGGATLFFARKAALARKLPS